MVVMTIIMVVEVVEMVVVAKTKNISKAFKINRKKRIPRAREVSLLEPLLSPGVVSIARHKKSLYSH